MHTGKGMHLISWYSVEWGEFIWCLHTSSGGEIKGVEDPPNQHAKAVHIWCRWILAMQQDFWSSSVHKHSKCVVNQHIIKMINNSGGVHFQWLGQHYSMCFTQKRWGLYSILAQKQTQLHKTTITTHSILTGTTTDTYRKPLCSTVKSHFFQPQFPDHKVFLDTRYIPPNLPQKWKIPQISAL